MKDVFAKVRPACDFAGVLSSDAALVVRGGRMEAYNKFLRVSTPCDLPEFAVSCVDFDFALKKYTDPELTVTEVNVLLKGNGTTRIKKAGLKASLKKPDVETVKIPDVADLMDALEDVFVFTVGDPARPWSEGARFDGDTITATNSVVLCQAKLKDATPFEALTISRPALAYMRQRREELESWGATEKGVLLEFTDGSWAVVSRMSMDMPDGAVHLINSVNDWSLSKVEPDYRDDIIATIEWADSVTDTASIYPDRVLCKRLMTEHEREIATELSSDAPAVFSARDLLAVMMKADEISFARFPSAVPFKTRRGSKGLIAGRN